jgi:signal transduction histidine kinase
VSSIRLFLTISIIAVVILANFLAAVHGYQESMQEAEILFDRKLQNYGDFISNSPFYSDSKENPVQENIVHSPVEHILYQVRDKNNLIIGQSSKFPQELKFELLDNQRYVNFDKARWRAITKFNTATERWVVVLENQDVRYNLAESVILKSVYPIVLAIPTIILIVLFIVHIGLKPIRLLANQVEKKKASNLTAIEIDGVPIELERLTQRVNQLLIRLDGSLSRESRFASDAAHELRTPIAALNLQMKNLLDEQADYSIESNENIRALSMGVSRMSHLVEQILVLNRSNPELYVGRFKHVSLSELLRALVIDLYPMIEKAKHEIELRLSNESDSYVVKGEEFALSTLFKNLLINAIKYTPEHGQILILISDTDNQIIVKVMDSGIGIPDAKKDRIFERFYRVDGDRNQSQITGCGLGLAIVKQIAELHHIKLTLSDSCFEIQSGKVIEKGLTVTLEFEKYSNGRQKDSSD